MLDFSGTCPNNSLFVQAQWNGFSVTGTPMCPNRVCVWLSPNPTHRGLKAPDSSWAEPRLSTRTLFPCQMLLLRGVETWGLLRRKNICLQWVQVTVSGHHYCDHYCEMLEKEVLQKEKRKAPLQRHCRRPTGHSPGKWSLAGGNVSQEIVHGFAANSHSCLSSNG